MRAVFSGHHLGHRRRGPEGFRHHRQKGPVVDHLLGALCRVYRLLDLWIQKRKENGFANLADTPGIGFLTTTDDRQQTTDHFKMP